MSLIRVLVIEDFEPFRRFVVSTLQRHPELHVIGEVSDGLEAVRKAQELQPDLVLLDIGLPRLNGMEVARQICKICPRSEIVFVSQESSSDIAQTALAVGAKGYVVKMHAGRDLMAAVMAVLSGEQFLSPGLGGGDFSDSRDQPTLDYPDRRKVVAPLPPENVAIRHEVAFYPDDVAFVLGFACLTEAALRVGNAAILIATASHRSEILERLRAGAVNVDAALKDGSLIQQDALDAVSSVMGDDLPDTARCANLISDLVTRASKAAKGVCPRVAICGECAPTLLAEGRGEAAIRLEHLWDEITRNYHADTLCGYLWNVFPERERSSMFLRICAEHSAVVARELGY